MTVIEEYRLNYLREVYREIQDWYLVNIPLEDTKTDIKEFEEGYLIFNLLTHIKDLGDFYKDEKTPSNRKSN